MSRLVIAGVIALSFATIGVALAQQSPRPDAPRWRPSVEDMAALTDARIAALKAGLKLSVEQEKNWPPVETAMRDLAKQRAERVAAPQSAAAQGASADAIDRMRRGADAMQARASGLRRFADAAEPLYRSLDQDQKRRFALLLRAGRQEQRAAWRQPAGAAR